MNAIDAAALSGGGGSGVGAVSVTKIPKFEACATGVTLEGLLVRKDLSVVGCALLVDYAAILVEGAVAKYFGDSFPVSTNEPSDDSAIAIECDTNETTSSTSEKYKSAAEVVGVALSVVSEYSNSCLCKPVVVIGLYAAALTTLGGNTDIAITGVAT